MLILVFVHTCLHVFICQSVYVLVSMRMFTWSHMQYLCAPVCMWIPSAHVQTGCTPSVP